MMQSRSNPMQIEQTPLPGVLLITPPRFGDARGWFSESYNAAKLAALGVKTVFVQDNHSFSAPLGTVRGQACPVQPGRDF
jgi:dTDP-4-dehydrorhamnose 3,5-epimerase